MSRWRPLEDYTSFARTIVLYMWEQRSHLLPAQFADRAGVSRQLISRILNQNVQPDPLAVRAIARSMQLPPSQLFTLAGYTTEADPLYAQEEVWDVVLAKIMAADGLTEAERSHWLTRLAQIRDESVVAGGDREDQEDRPMQERSTRADDVDERVSA